MLTISNIDKETEEIIIFITQKAGGSVVYSDKNPKKKHKASGDNPFEEFDKKMDSIIASIKKRHNAISENKIK